MPGKEAKLFFRDEKGAPKNFCRAATKPEILPFPGIIGYDFLIQKRKTFYALSYQIPLGDFGDVHDRPCHQ
jgi:hypothetical protein